MSRFLFWNDTYYESTEIMGDEMQQKQQDEYETSNGSDDISLFDLYGQAIFAYIRLHSSSREDAEDVTLEVFIAALEHDNLSGLQGSERLAWLRRVAYNKLVDSYRSSAHRSIVTLDQVGENMLDDKSRSPEQLILQRETYAQLYRVINTLPALQQQVLRLHCGDGLRFAEIAVLLNKREEAVRKIFSRTLALMRASYKQQTGEGES
ncbi:MAG TPA: RNA polymerase sigma factor [Ktedonobacteraceae bacterium]